MGRTEKYSYTGQCPFTNTKQTIKVEYFVIPVVQSLKPVHKKKTLHCPDCDNYSCRDNLKQCPIYNNAPDDPSF